MTKVRAYKQGDIDTIPERVEDVHRQWFESLLILSDTAVTLTDDDGNVCVVMGSCMLWVGVADIWSLVHPESKVPSITLVRDTRKIIEDYCLEYAVKRCNASAFSNEQHQWMRLLGFVDEGRKTNYGPAGQDVIDMVKWSKRVTGNERVQAKEEWVSPDGHVPAARPA